MTLKGITSGPYQSVGFYLIGYCYLSSEQLNGYARGRKLYFVYNFSNILWYIIISARQTFADRQTVTSLNLLRDRNDVTHYVQKITRKWVMDTDKYYKLENKMNHFNGSKLCTDNVTTKIPPLIETGTSRKYTECCLKNKAVTKTPVWSRVTQGSVVSHMLFPLCITSSNIILSP